MSDEYPHWREALFGNNGAVANLRCAVKYGFWHAGYLLMLLLGIVLLVGAWALDRVTGTETVARLRSASQHPYVSDAVDLILAWACGVYLGLVVAVGLIEVIRNPMLLVYGIGIAIGTIVVLAVVVALAVNVWRATRETRQTTVQVVGGAARQAGERAVETPGVRRVYGQCPVSMDIEPKWFERVTEAFE